MVVVSSGVESEREVRTAALFGEIPERFRYPQRPHGPQPIPIEATTSALSFVRRALECLGPPIAQEPPGWRDEMEILSDARLATARIEDLHVIDAEWVAERLKPAQAPRTAVTLMRGWLRYEIEAVLTRTFSELPSRFQPGFEAHSGLACQWLEETAALVTDRARASCFAALPGSTGPELADLARRLYHAPEAGPRLRKQVLRIFVGETLERILADSESESTG